MVVEQKATIIESAVPYEKKWMEKWKQARIFEADPDPSKPKFMICVPYSYQNGPLHIGHGFTFTRGDVYARFKRMQGYNVLFPWAWHWTGEAVAGTSERLKQGDQFIRKVLIEIDGVPPEIVEKFTDPAYISKYYTEENRKVVEAIGFSVDFRREFYTTDLHPYYSYFIKWQYNTLRKKKYVALGKHPVVWCPKCQSPTGDHDRLIGEGVSPQEYTIVFFSIDGAYLAAATLRPETIFGVTNIWLNPNHEYVLIEVDGKKLIVSRKAALKLSEQKKNVKILDAVNPDTLIGKYAKTPLIDIEVPILPAEFVDPDFGTGVVYSVPGHAPYDYAGLLTLKTSSKWDKYNIKEIVEKIKPISIIKVEGYGEYPAVEIVEKMKILDDKDPRLEEATREIYSKEFHSGVMKDNCREFSGKTVSIARDEVKHKLIEMKLGDVLWELPEKVVCRCGTECLVKIVENQWFLTYSDPEWKSKVKEHILNMKIIPEEARQWFLNVVDWLKDWACTRKTGLGTRLPWDPEWIVETLSDSTIYPALYTISKHLNQGLVKPEQLTDEFFDYVFLGKGEPAKLSNKLKIDLRLLKEMREEFLYWYPVDMRISAKELVPNHLTFYIFHHVAIFDEKHWPRGIAVNGMITIEGEKMSKSRGNVIDPVPILEKYGADVFRFWCAQEANLGEDFRISEQRIQSAGRFITKLWNIARYISSFPYPRTAELTPTDKWILSELSKTIEKCLEGYADFNFFIPSTTIRYFTWNIFADHYIEMCKPRAYGVSGFTKREQKSAWHTLHTVLKNILIMLAPITPFITEEIWRKLYSKKSIHLQKFQKPRWSKRYAKYTEHIINFNSRVWSIKKERNLSLKDPIDIEIPRELRIFKKDLIAMHNIRKN
ncbi:MAG: leucine--tRNA ligase [Nitrososphaerota archaeon]